jgi:pimeloyl-ACP methyl ester carboxylesterase
MKNQSFPFRNRHLSSYFNDNRRPITIIFLHGNSCSSRLWQKQFESTLNDKYQLVAFDFMGFGNSDHSDTMDDYSITALKDSVQYFIKEQGLDNYFIVGHSLGAHVIHQLSNELKGCKGIVSIGAPPISLPPDVTKIYLATAPTDVMFIKDFTEADLDRVTSVFFHSQADTPPFFKEDFRKSDSNTRAAIGATLGDPAFKDEVVELHNSQLRKLFISGKEERSINNEYYSSLNFPNTWRQKVFTIENAGHVPQWENVDAVNQLIDEFAQEAGNNE